MEDLENHLDLSEPEQKEAEERNSVTPHVVHEAVRREGEEELKRSNAALAWSGLAAGLSMGFSSSRRASTRGSNDRRFRLSMCLRLLDRRMRRESACPA